MASTPLASPRTAPEDTIAGFTRAIERELAGEALELPSFPEIALRVRKALGNPDISIDEVVRIVSAEPSLAVRLLQLANSAALNPGMQRITSLRPAVARIGFNLACSATIAFAMSQMRRAEAWRGLEKQFRALWEQSASLAATAHIIAKRARHLSADQALLAGMLHAVGKLFVLTRLSRFPALFAQAAVHAELEHAWHGRLARAILTRWELAEEIVAAASEFELAGTARDGAANLEDVLYAAQRLASTPGADAGTNAGAAAFDAPPLQRLGLDSAACKEVLAASAEQIASLRNALID